MKISTLFKLILLTLPLLEIAVFIWVGGLIGIGWTILLIIASSVFGVMLMRSQGFKMLQEFAHNARNKRAEPADVMHGSFIVIGGFLLIIPGFITDIIGLLCLLPFSRHFIVKCLILGLAKPTAAPYPTNSHPVIEGKFTETHKNPHSHE